MFLIEQYQPIGGLIFGSLMLVFAAVANYGDIKIRTLNWIARCIYRNDPRSAAYSKRFLEGITIYILIVGPALVMLALYFLKYIK